MAEAADIGEWQGGHPPGGVYPYSKKGHQVAWRFEIGGGAAEDLPRSVPRSKLFSFSKYGEGAKAAAEAYQRQLAEDYGLEIKNRYRYREDPNAGIPYIECHIRDSEGEDHYLICDVEGLPLLEEHIWSVTKNDNNIYAQTNLTIDGKKTMKKFHRFERPDWPIVDHFSENPRENRNGLDNRSKHLRDGSGGANQENCRPRKDSKSGITGVGYNNTNKTWYGYITRNKETKWSPPYHGPEDKTHPSYLAACEWRKEQAAAVGNTNGQ